MSDNFFSESDWSYDLFCDPISQFLQSKSNTGDFMPRNYLITSLEIENSFNQYKLFFL